MAAPAAPAGARRHDEGLVALHLLLDYLLELVDDAGSLREGRAEREGNPERDGGIASSRHHADPHGRYHQERHDEGGSADENRDKAVVQRGLQDGPVEAVADDVLNLVQHAVEDLEEGVPQGLLVPVGQRQEEARQHRHQKDCDEEGGDQGDYDREDDSLEHLPHHAEVLQEEEEGDEDADRRQVAGEDGHQHLGASEDGGDPGLGSARAVAVDVVYHDDGSVHYHAHAQDKARQRNHVQRHAHEVHAQDGDDDGKGDGDPDDYRALHGAKEEVEDYDREDKALPRRVEQGAQRVADGLGGVADYLQVYVGGKDFLHLLYLLVDRVSDGDGVRAGLLGDGDVYPRLAVYVDLVGRVGEAHVGPPQVGQLDVVAVLCRDDRVVYLVYAGIQARRPYRIVQYALSDRAAAQVHVLLGERRGHLGQGQPVCLKAVKLQLHAHELGAASHRGGLPYPVRLLQYVRDDVLRVTLQVVRRPVPAKGNPHDGIRGHVHLHDRRGHVLGEGAGHALQLLAHVVGGLVQVGAVREFE